MIVQRPGRMNRTLTEPRAGELVSVLVTTRHDALPESTDQVSATPGQVEKTENWFSYSQVFFSSCAADPTRPLPEAAVTVPLIVGIGAGTTGSVNTAVVAVNPGAAGAVMVIVHVPWEPLLTKKLFWELFTCGAQPEPPDPSTVMGKPSTTG